MTWNHPVYGPVPDDDGYIGSLHPANIERRQQERLVGRLERAPGTLGDLEPGRQQGHAFGQFVPAGMARLLWKAVRVESGPTLPPELLEVPQACRPRTPAQQAEIDAQMDKSLDAAAQSIAEWRRAFPEITDAWKNAARFQLPANPEPGTCWHVQGPCVIEVAPGTRLVNPPPGAVESVLAEEPYHLNSARTVAVANGVFWNEDMTTCPRGAKVQLLGARTEPEAQMTLGELYDRLNEAKRAHYERRCAMVEELRATPLPLDAQALVAINSGVG